MRFNIIYKASVERDLKRLTKVEARRILQGIERHLAEKAGAYPVLKGRFAGLRRFRVGDYRVIYAMNESNAIILHIRHRREAYR